MKFEDPLYQVTLVDDFGRNELPPMIEQHFYGYLRCRPLEGFTAEEVIEQLEENGTTTVYFQPTPGLGPRTKVDIQRVVKEIVR